MTPLPPYRVLDLTNERGFLCGQLLGDLGADVVKIEPPGGAPERRIGPFAGDEPHPDRSLFWWAYNRNKRSVTLDLDAEQGRELFLRMVERADFLIESESPGALDARGLGYREVAESNPRLIYVSITAFGQDGPKAHLAETDLILLAAGGPLSLTGDDDRPPLRLSVPQAYLHASADAAVGALVANHERARSGHGQHVDVSAQQSVTLATQSGLLASAVGSFEYSRLAGGVKAGPFSLRLLYPAKDGHVSIAFLFGSAIGPFTKKLMHYIFEEGGCDEATRDKDWIAYTELLMTGREPFSEYDRAKLVIEAFTKGRTKAALFAAARERGLLIMPVTRIDEVVASEQLGARGYWETVEHPELGRSVRYPGAFAKFSGTPLEIRRRPPTAGEHNREIYQGELGIGADRIAELAAKGVL